MERSPIIFQTRWSQIYGRLLLQENTWGASGPGSQAGTQLSDLATSDQQSRKQTGRRQNLRNCKTWMAHPQPVAGAPTASPPGCWPWLSPKETPEPDKERSQSWVHSSILRTPLSPLQVQTDWRRSGKCICGDSRCRQSMNRIARCGVCQRPGGQLASLMGQASRQRAREPT